jgi:hypothetical protein
VIADEVTDCANKEQLVASFQEVSVRNMVVTVCLFLCSSQVTEEVGGSNTQHTTRIQHNKAQRSLQDKMD